MAMFVVAYMFCMFMTAIAFMSMTMSPYMHAEVYAEADKECCGRIAYPFLEVVHTFGQFIDGDGAV